MLWTTTTSSIHYPERAKLVMHQVREGCAALVRDSPRELWNVYLLKFLDSCAYFSLSIVFTLFLSHDFGYSDVQAGAIYGAWGAFITMYGLATGVVVDQMGVAMSLRMGFSVSLLSRCLLFATTSRRMMWLNIGCLLPLGNCLGIPVLTIGIRRYTKVQNRGFAYGLFYVVMNLAALMSGPIVDICKRIFQLDKNKEKETGGATNNSSQEGDFAEKEWEWNQYRMVMFTGIIANVLAVMTTFTIREIRIQEDSPNVVANAEEDALDEPHLPNTSTSSNQSAGSQASVRVEAASTHSDQPCSNVTSFTPIKASARKILQETLQTKSFWRFLVVCLILINVRMIFRHLDATFPKYMLREFGESVPYGTIYSINPAIIMILVPITTAATSHVEPLVMIHAGSYVSALSVFFLAMSTSIPACILFVVTLSIGEAIWSPRLYDYTMSVSEEGREGTYMALSSAPLFLAKLPVGFLSGYLLQEYCPAEGERRSKLMWLIIGMTTATSPMFMTVFWRFISHKDKSNVEARAGHDPLESPNTKGGRYTELTSNPNNVPTLN